MTHRPARDSRGFTFLEITITVILIVIGIMPMIYAMTTAIVADQAVEAQSTALELAQEKIESLIPSSVTCINVERGSVDGFSDFERSVSCGTVDAYSQAVNVRVFWKHQGAFQEDQPIVLETIKYVPGG